MTTSSLRALTASSVQTATAFVTLEVLCLLMRDEDFQIVKVAFAVVAPWALEDVLDARMIFAFFVAPHIDRLVETRFDECCSKGYKRGVGRLLEFRVWSECLRTKPSSETWS